MSTLIHLKDSGALRGEAAMLRFFWDLFWLMDSENPHSAFWAKTAMTRFAALLDYSDVGDKHLHQLAFAMRNILISDDFEEFRHPFHGMEEAAERDLYEKLCSRLNRYCDEKIKTDYRTMKPQDSSVVGFNVQQLLKLIDPDDELTLMFAEDFLGCYSYSIGPWEDYLAQQQKREAFDLMSAIGTYSSHKEDYIEIPGDPVESIERRRRMEENIAPIC